jgi:hypothetical protein
MIGSKKIKQLKILNMIFIIIFQENEIHQEDNEINSEKKNEME